MIVQNYSTLIPKDMTNKELRSLLYQFEITKNNFRIYLKNGHRFEVCRSSEYRYIKEQEIRLGIKIK